MHIVVCTIDSSESQQIGFSAFGFICTMLWSNSLRHEQKRKETLFLGISKCVRPMKKNSFHISDSVKALPSLAIILLVNREKSVIKKKVLLQENC